LSSFLFLHCTLPSFELNLLWDQLRHNLKFFASEQDAKQPQFHSTFPFLGLSHLFVKKNISNSKPSVQSFPFLNNQHNLKSHAKRLLLPLSLFIVTIYLDYHHRDDLRSILSFEFCAISLYYLILLKAEMRFPPPRKKKAFISFNFFLRVVGKRSNFCANKATRKIIVKVHKIFFKSQEQKCWIFFSQSLLFGERRKIVLPMLF